MKNKIFLIVALASIMSLGSCNDFLDETPNKSGSAYIYHMDQHGSIVWFDGQFRPLFV